MKFYEIILIAVALSMDACALTISNCSVYKEDANGKKAWSMPLAFAVFQGAMPLIGYFIGSIFSSTISMITEYLTAGIFFVLAIKIVVDISKEKKEQVIELKSRAEKKEQTVKFTLLILLAQALATSIDALAVGVTFVGISIPIYFVIPTIMIITFALVSVALLFGKKLGKLFGEYAEWVGAVVLFVLAIKSLIQAII